MKPLDKFTFSPKHCFEELYKFEQLLASKPELKESEDILPFFKKHKNIAAYIGNYAPTLVEADLLSSEYTLFGDFRTDLIIGDSKRHSYCLVEFEDATKDSVFEAKVRTTKEWSSRFEHGFSQLVDWFWKVDDLRNTAQGRAIFGNDTFSFVGMLIVGRDQFLAQGETARLNWRVNKVKIDSNTIVCLTFDQLASGLRSKLTLFDLYAKSLKKS
jgi:hypothetical protein